jgi:hypothetical protein
MIATVRILETVTRTALLGVRLWDPVSGGPVSDRIQVTETASGRTALTNPSGVFAFHDLPGLHAASVGLAGGAFWQSPPARASFTFEVVDLDQRFLPFRFSADPPCEGLFAPACVGATSMPLFSSPGRPTVPGFATVRADLWDVVADVPAASAVLEIDGVGNAPWRGVADAQGRVLLLCPYPEPRWLGSSPPAGSLALSDQSWPVTLSVRYATGATGDPRNPAPAADICAVLTQPPATLLSTVSPESPLPAQTLVFGRELILRSGSMPVLLVVPT